MQPIESGSLWIKCFITFLLISIAVYVKTYSFRWTGIEVNEQHSLLLMFRATSFIIITSAMAYYFTSGSKNLPQNYSFFLFTLLAYSMFLMEKGGGLEISYRMYYYLGPGCVLASFILFIGASKKHWQTILKAMLISSYAASLYVVYQVFTTPVQIVISPLARYEMYQRLYIVSLVLEVIAIIPVAYFIGHTGKRKVLAWVPMVALGMSALMMQCRLSVIATTVILVLYLILLKRGNTESKGLITSTFGLALIATSIILVLIVSDEYFAYRSSGLYGSAIKLWERRLEDTRSEQFFAFFQKVSIEDMVYGVGIPSPGEFTGQGKEGIDLGFINILYIGGFPLLVLFSIIHLFPAIRASTYRLAPVDAACCASVLTWTIKLFSSNFPHLAPNYFFLLLLMGRIAFVASNLGNDNDVLRKKPAINLLSNGKHQETLTA